METNYRVNGVVLGEHWIEVFNVLIDADLDPDHFNYLEAYFPSKAVSYFEKAQKINEENENKS